MIKKEELSKESQELLDLITENLKRAMSDATKILLIECFSGDVHPRKVLPLLQDTIHKSLLFTNDICVHDTPESVH